MTVRIPSRAAAGAIALLAAAVAAGCTTFDWDSLDWEALAERLRRQDAVCVQGYTTVVEPVGNVGRVHFFPRLRSPERDFPGLRLTMTVNDLANRGEARSPGSYVTLQPSDVEAVTGADGRPLMDSGQPVYQTQRAQVSLPAPGPNPPLYDVTIHVSNQLRQPAGSQVECQRRRFGPTITR